MAKWCSSPVTRAVHLPLCRRRLLLQVGPESAGAHPGPVCYRKSGYLAITGKALL